MKILMQVKLTLSLIYSDKKQISLYSEISISYHPNLGDEMKQNQSSPFCIPPFSDDYRKWRLTKALWHPKKTYDSS